MRHTRQPPTPIGEARRGVDRTCDCGEVLEWVEPADRKTMGGWMPCYLHRAAPHMRDALRRAEGFLSRCAGNGGSTEGQNTSLSEELEALRTALQASR